MNRQELEQAINQQVSLTSQKVLIAKRFLTEHHGESQIPSELLKSFLRQMDAVLPGEIVINPTVNLDPVVKAVSESIVWHLAFHEGLWALIRAGLLLVSDPSNEILKPHVNIFEGHPGSGGYRSGMSFGNFDIWLPRGVKKSRIDDSAQSISDPGLYLANLNIPRLHDDAEEALDEAVRCFRQELFLAAAVMLGRASEIVWSELGVSLSRVDIVNPKKVDSNQTLVNRIRAIVKGLEAETAKDLLKKCAVGLGDVRDAEAWAHAVRDARNYIHHGVDPAVENAYEKVAVLLLAAVPNVRSLWRIKTATDS